MIDTCPVFETNALCCNLHMAQLLQILIGWPDES